MRGQKGGRECEEGEEATIALEGCGRCIGGTVKEGEREGGTGRRNSRKRVIGKRCNGERTK